MGNPTEVNGDVDMARTAANEPPASIEPLKIDPIAIDLAQTASSGVAPAAHAKDSAAASTAALWPARYSRFTLLAASIAAVSALGAFVGSMGATGVARLLPQPTPAAASVKHNDQLAAEVRALKSNLDAATRNVNAQFTKIAGQIERAEHAQADPAAKLARLADAVERLEKRPAAAPETTGSIGAAPPASAESRPPVRVLEGWVLHQVDHGRALVESRYGNMFEIAAGGFLPGVGRIEQIKRQDGHWVVVTARGLIEGYY